MDGELVYCSAPVRRRHAGPGARGLRVPRPAHATRRHGAWLVVADAPRTVTAARPSRAGLRDSTGVPLRVAHERSSNVSRAVRPWSDEISRSSPTRARGRPVTRLRKKSTGCFGDLGRQNGAAGDPRRRRALARTAGSGNGGRRRQRVSACRRGREGRGPPDCGGAGRGDRISSPVRHGDSARRRPPDAAPRCCCSKLFMVPVARGRAFRAETARRARALAPEGYDLSLSGPWPPYSFVTDAP